MNIKITMRYRAELLFIIGGALLIALIGAITVLFAADGEYALAALGGALVLIIIVGLFFRFNYCIKINERRLFAIEQGSIMALNYDEISRITVCFNNDSISVAVRMKNGKEHAIVWDSLFLGTSLFLPSHVMLRLDRQFVDECKAKLSACDKVTVFDRYSKD